MKQFIIRSLITALILFIAALCYLYFSLNTLVKKVAPLDSDSLLTQLK